MWILKLDVAYDNLNLVLIVILVAEMSGNNFWRHPFSSLTSPKQLVEFMVMQVDDIPEKDKPHKSPMSNKVCYFDNNQLLIKRSVQVRVIDSGTSCLCFWKVLGWWSSELTQILEKW